MICGALPTLRKFFWHVAPRLIGESASSQPPAHIPGNTNLRTFGSSGQKRRQYRRFEDTGSYALGTLPQDDGADAAARLRPDRTIEKHAVAASGAAARDGGGGADDGHDGAGDYADNDSEKGIMQTKTTVISYSTTSRSRQGDTGSSGD